MSIQSRTIIKSLFSKPMILQCLYCPTKSLNLKNYSSATESKVKNIVTENEIEKDNNTELTFEELLKESPLMKLGRADGKCVVGKVTDVCNDDLYIDFGGKFDAVVKIPETKENYAIGTLVRLIINKFELTGQFLGDPRHVTLNEADGFLIGLYNENNDKILVNKSK